jgi:hypothetical protein
VTNFIGIACSNPTGSVVYIGLAMRLCVVATFATGYSEEFSNAFIIGVNFADFLTIDISGTAFK